MRMRLPGASDISRDKALAMCALIPSCRLSADEMLARVNTAVLDASMGDFLQAAERGEDRKRLVQALGAAEKLARLLGDPGVSQAVHQSWDRRYSRGDASSEPDYAIVEGVAADLPALIERLVIATETEPTRDKRRDDALQALVSGLARVWCDATGEAMPFPTWHPIDDIFCESFDRFLTFWSLATCNLFIDASPSGEVIRHRLRDAMDLGEVATKKVGPRLGQRACVGTIQAVTQSTDEVTDELDQANRPAQRAGS